MASIPDYTILERLLSNWAEYMKTGGVKLGYPSKSLGISSGGQSVVNAFEHECEVQDENAARIMDTLVHDLPSNQRGVIYHHWLGCIIRVRNGEEVLLEAYVTLEKGRLKWGLA